MSNHLLTPTKAICLTEDLLYMLILEADPGIFLEGEELKFHASVSYVGKATVVRIEHDTPPTIMGHALKRWAESVGCVVDSNPAESGVMVIPGRELFEAVVKLAAE